MRDTILRHPSPIWALLLVVVFLLAFVGTASAADQWTDISDARWVSDYGLTAGEAFGVAEGYSDGSFHPYEDVFRGQTDRGKRLHRDGMIRPNILQPHRRPHQR